MEKRPNNEDLPLPEDRVVFQDRSMDGSLTITVWRDDEPETELMREFGGMGTLRVYSSHTGILHHEERLPLSSSAIFGASPTGKEVERWTNIFSLFLEE